MQFLSTGFWVTIALGTALILSGIGPYFVPGGEHPFVLEKEPISRTLAYAASLRVHVAAGAICLPVCIALFSRWILRVWRSAHRVLGYVYALAILFLVPTGLYLSIYAKGGVAGSLGFALSGVLAFFATGAGVLAAIRGQHSVHRAWMMRSAAQVTVAVSSRIMLFVFAWAGMNDGENYLLSLWLSVLGSALVAELIIFHARQRRLSRGVRHAAHT